MMQHAFYALPLDLDNVIRQRQHSYCSLQQSVVQHLHLLLTTAYGEFQSDPQFGCGIWDHDFDNVTSPHKLKEFIRLSLLASITTQEKRLQNIRIEVVLRHEELKDGISNSKAKKRIDVKVHGVLVRTNEPISFQDNFFVGPLSY